MAVVKLENGVVVQAWYDVDTLQKFRAKYGQDGPDLAEAGDDVRPGQRRSGGRFVDPPPEPEPEAEDIRLSGRQFRWMLTYYGYDEGWQALLDATRAGRAGAGPMRALDANLAALRDGAGSYRLQPTLALLAQIRDDPLVRRLGMDLSDATVTERWQHAARQTFADLRSVDP